VATIQSSLNLLARVRDDLGQQEIIAAVSAGKDSLATIDLCHRAFGAGNVHAYFMWIVKGLECEERYLRAVESRYGLVIHRLPHPAIGFYLRNSVLSPRRMSAESEISRDLKYGDVERVVRFRTGASWIAGGHRITDSLQRRGMIKSSGGILENRRWCYPVWDWSSREVYDYLRARKIEVPPAIRHANGRSANTSGIAPNNVDSLLWLRKYWPADYQKVCEAFPYAERVVMRDEMRAKYEVTVAT
jgi:phosphoadenosine phosphosulfate reductase